MKSRLPVNYLADTGVISSKEKHKTRPAMMTSTKNSSTLYSLLQCFLGNNLEITPFNIFVLPLLSIFLPFKEEEEKETQCYYGNKYSRKKSRQTSIRLAVATNASRLSQDWYVSKSRYTVRELKLPQLLTCRIHHMPSQPTQRKTMP